MKMKEKELNKKKDKTNTTKDVTNDNLKQNEVIVSNKKKLKMRLSDDKTNKLEQNDINVSDKTLKVSNKDKLNTTNDDTKSENVYKLKISKNSIKSKNIESLYPNNIGVKETKNSYLILYKNQKAANKDLKVNEKYKFYNDKLIFSNFSYKENEESIRTFLEEVGEIVEITLEENKDKIFTGKAIVSFAKSVKIDKELKLNNKIIRVERIRKQDMNDKRIFIGRIDMNLSILEIRNAVKSTGAKLTDIRIRFEKESHKNIGYGHLSFKTRDDAIKFENNFQELKKVLGPHSFYEYAKEKFIPSRRK